MGNNPSGPEDASTLATPLSTTFTAQWATIQPHNQVDPNHNVPLAREGHCAVVNEGKLIVCCGAIQNNDKSIGQSNAVYSFDLDKHQWAKVDLPIDSFLPATRSGAAFAQVGHKLYVLNGMNEDGWLSDVAALNLTTLEWEKIIPKGTAPSPRDKLTAVAVGPVIYIFGGFGPPKGVVPKMPYQHGEDQEEEEHKEDSETASAKKSDSHANNNDKEKKEDEESIDEEDAADNEGEEENPDDYESEEEPPATLFDWFGDLYAFDTRTNEWSQLSTIGTAPTPRAGYGMAALNNEIYLFGGKDKEKRTSDLFKLDLGKMEWKKLTGSGRTPMARSFVTLTSVDNKLVLIGGINRGNTHLNEVHVYDPRIGEQGAWYQPAVSGTFQPRGFHTVSHWNSETNTHKLVVFGGSSSYNAATMSSSVYFNDVNLITLKLE
jgi:N-acetylneuraminic acid mutarotase